MGGKGGAAVVQGCSVAVPGGRASVPGALPSCFLGSDALGGTGESPAKPGGRGDTSLSPLPWSRWGAGSGAIPCRGRPFAPATSWQDQRGAGGEGRAAIVVFSPSRVLVRGGRGDGHGAGYRYAVPVGLRWVPGAQRGSAGWIQGIPPARLRLPGASRCFSPRFVSISRNGCRADQLPSSEMGSGEAGCHPLSPRAEP